MDALALQTQANKAWYLHQIKPSASKTCSNYLGYGINGKWVHYQVDIKNWYQPSLIKKKEVNLNWLRHVDWYSCLVLDCHVFNEYYVCSCLWKMIIVILNIIEFFICLKYVYPLKVVGYNCFDFLNFHRISHNAKYVLSMFLETMCLNIYLNDIDCSTFKAHFTWFMRTILIFHLSFYS